jgi:hypothetical protein
MYFSYILCLAGLVVEVAAVQLVAMPMVAARVVVQVDLLKGLLTLFPDRLLT